MNNFLAFSMEWLAANLDLVLILLILVFVIIGAIRGFCAQLAGAISTITAIVVACVAAKPLFSFLSSNTSVCSNVNLWVSGRLGATFSTLENIAAEDAESKIAALPLPQIVKNTITAYVQTQTGSSVNLTEAISQTLANYIVLALSFVIVFVAVKLLFFLLRKIVKMLRKISLVRYVDGGLGILLAVFKLFIALSFVFFLIKILPFDGLSGLQEAAENSKIATFITNFNFFEFLLTLIAL